jgi:hypothetical protein
MYAFFTCRRIRVRIEFQRKMEKKHDTALKSGLVFGMAITRQPHRKCTWFLPLFQQLAAFPPEAGHAQRWLIRKKVQPGYIPQGSSSSFSFFAVSVREQKVVALCANSAQANRASCKDVMPA